MISRVKSAWRRKVVFSLMTLTAAGLLWEGFLALMGVPPLRSDTQLWPGPPEDQSLFVHNGKQWVTRKERLTYFNEQSFATVKSKRTYRIFCLGGSTTYGHPYADNRSYVGGLRELLRRSVPDVEWEVINCGGISYASYRLAGMMRELVKYDPDLFIVYTGQNEFLEERTFREHRNRSASWKLAQECIGRTRTGTLFARLWHEDASDAALLDHEVDTILDRSSGPVRYQRDLNLQSSVVSQYGESLRSVASRARSAGASIVFIEPASNLRFSPFKSQPGQSGGSTTTEVERLLSDAVQYAAEGDVSHEIEALRAAVEADPEYAESAYRLGQAQYAQGAYTEAERNLRTALDEDVCPLRAISPLIQTLRTVAAEEALPLISFPQLVTEYSQAHGGHGVAGPESFLDHVHPNPELHLQLALQIARTLHAEGIVSQPAPDTLDAKLEEVRAAIVADVSPADEAMALCNLAQVLTWGGKIEESLPLAAQAVQLDPENVWIICQYARLLDKRGRRSESRAEYNRALELSPHDPLANYRMGRMLLEDGDASGAITYLNTSREHMTMNAPAAIREGLQRALNEAQRQQSITNGGTRDE